MVESALYLIGIPTVVVISVAILCEISLRVISYLKGKDDV